MKFQKWYLFLSCLLLLAAVPLFAQTAHQITTIQATAAPYSTPWVDSGYKAGAAWTSATNYVEIFPATEYQEMYGFGGTFDELAWGAMKHLDSAGRDSVMRALFDTSGCNLSWGRIPVGCCDYDYAVAPYSCDDNSGDTSMSKFSLARDSTKKIPFIKYAQAIRAAEGQPAMRFFASPWSPPGWMKTGSTNYAGGNFNSTPANCRAYALYLDKFVQGYAAAGINIESITAQNEPNENTGGYPQCGWTQVQEDTFYHYLVPQFKKDSLSARILLGVQCCEDNNWVLPFFQDAIDSPFINWTSHSYQTPGDGPTFIADDPKIPFLESESMWNPSGETWSVGTSLFTNIQQFMADCTSVYTIWQECSNKSGNNGGFAGLGSQPEMITIDTTVTPSPVVYAPEFYACKHYSHFLQTGAYFVKSTNHGTAPTASSAFLNPDGSIIYVAEATAATALTIKVGTEMYLVNMPANSYTTVKITNSTAVRDIQLARNSAASQLNNLRIRNSTLYFSLSPAMNAMEANLTLTDLQGRTLWTGHRTGSALRGGQQSFAIGTAHGSLPSGTYLLAAKIKNVAGAVVSVEKKVSTVN